MTRIKVGAVILAVIVLAGMCIYCTLLRAELFGKTEQLKVAEQRAALAEAESAAMAQEIEAGRRALEAREKQRAELTAQTEALRHELDELYRNLEPCAAWADALMPDPVRDRLRK